MICCCLSRRISTPSTEDIATLPPLSFAVVITQDHVSFAISSCFDDLAASARSTRVPGNGMNYRPASSRHARQGTSHSCDNARFVQPPVIGNLAAMLGLRRVPTNPPAAPHFLLFPGTPGSHGFSVIAPVRLIATPQRVTNESRRGWASVDAAQSSPIYLSDVAEFS